MNTPTISETIVRLLEPFENFFTPEIAREFLKIRVTPEQQKRIDYLNAIRPSGEFTLDEESEMRLCDEFLEFLEALKSKAREAL